jgi:ferredoxin
MIVAEQKAMDEILRSVRDYNDIAVVSCGSCVTVCMAGGEKEAAGLACLIRLAATEEGREVNVRTANPIRQCDMEFFDSLEFGEDGVGGAGCVLSLGCGAGVQFMAERYPDKVVIPGLNTTFLGVNRELGYWTEMCQGCGNCILEKTGGICPVARCSKSHFNGPCGGSSKGRCEIDPDVDCAWQMIYDRLKRIGQLHRLSEINDVRDWSTSRDGGPRRHKRDDVRVDGSVVG